MASKVVFEVDARHAGAIAKFLQFQRVVEGSGKSMDDMGKKGSRAGRRMSARMMGFGRQILQTTLLFSGFGASLGAIAGFVQVIRREYDFMKERKLAAGTFAERADPGIAKLKASFGKPFKTDAIKNLEDWNQKMLSEIVATGLLPDVGKASELSAAIISMSGQQVAYDKMFENLRTITKITGPNPELEAGMALGRALTMQQQRSGDVTALGAEGRMVQLLKFLPQSDIQTAAGNVMPGVMNAISRGLTFEQGGGASIAIGQTAGDPRGLRTAAAVNKMTEWAAQAQMEIAKRDPRVAEMDFNKFYNLLFKFGQYQFKGDERLERLTKAGRARFMGAAFKGEREGMTPREIASERRMAGRLLPGLPEATFQHRTRFGALGIADVARRLTPPTGVTHPRELFEKYLKDVGGLSENDYRQMATRLNQSLQGQPTRLAIAGGAAATGAAQAAMFQRPGEMVQGQILLKIKNLEQQLGSSAILTSFRMLKETLSGAETGEAVRKRQRDWARENILAITKKKEVAEESERSRAAFFRVRPTRIFGEAERPPRLILPPTPRELKDRELLTNYINALLKISADERAAKRLEKEKKALGPGPTEGSALPMGIRLQEKLLETLDKNTEAILQLQTSMTNQKMKVDIDDKAGTALHQTTTVVTPTEEHMGDGITG